MLITGNPSAARARPEALPPAVRCGATPRYLTITTPTVAPNLLPETVTDCWRSSVVEQLPCKQQVVGSIPTASSAGIDPLPIVPFGPPWLSTQPSSSAWRGWRANRCPERDNGVSTVDAARNDLRLWQDTAPSIILSLDAGVTPRTSTGSRYGLPPHADGGCTRRASRGKRPTSHAVGNPWDVGREGVLHAGIGPTRRHQPIGAMPTAWRNPGGSMCRLSVADKTEESRRKDPSAVLRAARSVLSRAGSFRSISDRKNGVPLAAPIAERQSAVR